MTSWFCLITATLMVAYTSAQEKWVWNEKSARAISGGGGLRYGVYEGDGLDEADYRPESRLPPRDRRPLVRPPPPVVNQPPPYGPPPFPGAKPDLDPTRFEKCKCVHSFNCKSPGLLFGSCDAGKKYCCEKSVRGGRTDYRPNNEYPEVLAGPGGPVDDIKRPIDGDLPFGLGSFAERPPQIDGAGPRPGRPGAYGPRPDGSLGYGPRPDGPLGYGIRPDGSLGYAPKPNGFSNRQDSSNGNGGYGRPFEQRPRQ